MDTIRNIERDFRGDFYSPGPRGVKIPEGLSRRYFLILSTNFNPLRCLNMSRKVKNSRSNSPAIERP